MCSGIKINKILTSLLGTQYLHANPLFGLVGAVKCGTGVSLIWYKVLSRIWKKDNYKYHVYALVIADLTSFKIKVSKNSEK